MTITEIILSILWMALMLYFASGAWSASLRRRRFLCEEDFRRVEQWREEEAPYADGEDPLLAAAELALWEALGDGTVAPPNDRLPPQGGTE